MRLLPWRRRERRDTLANPSEQMFEAFGAGPTASGQSVSIPGSLGLIAVFGAVSKISETIGSLPLKVYRDLGEGASLEAPDHRAYRMLHDIPNPATPAPRFWSTLVGNLLLWGNGYLRKERDPVTGLVSTLWLLAPERVVVEWNETLGAKRFRYTSLAGREYYYSEDEVLHVLDFSLNGLVGESRIARCRETLGTALGRREFEAGFYARGFASAGVIEHPGQLKDFVKLREGWQAIYGGSGNAHQVAVLEEGATFRPIMAPLADLQFVESARLTNTEVAVLFNLPPAYLGGSAGDSLTYQTVEGNRLAFADALAPLCNSIARAIATDRTIFPFSSWFPEFEMKALMRGDSAARGAFYKDLSGVGAITPDEIRGLENLPPLEAAPSPTPPPPSDGGALPSPPPAAVAQSNGGGNG